MATITGSDHDVFCIVLTQLFGNGLNERRRRYHADLDGIRVDIGEHRIQLLGQKFGCGLKDAGYAGGVLGRQSVMALRANTPLAVMVLMSA